MIKRMYAAARPIINPKEIDHEFDGCRGRAVLYCQDIDCNGKLTWYDRDLAYCSKCGADYLVLRHRYSGWSTRLIKEGKNAGALFI